MFGSRVGFSGLADRMAIRCISGSIKSKAAILKISKEYVSEMCYSCHCHEIEELCANMRENHARGWLDWLQSNNSKTFLVKFGTFLRF